MHESKQTGPGEPLGREFERLRRLQDEALAAIRARGAGLHSADNLSRDELHEKGCTLLTRTH